MKKIFIIAIFNLFLVSFAFSQTYDYIDEFTTDLFGNMAIVSRGGQRDENGNYSGGKWGIISAKKPGILSGNSNKDRKIIEVVPLKYDLIIKNKTKFVNYYAGTFIVAIDGEWSNGKLIKAKYGVIDNKGKEIIKPIYELIVRIDKGPYFVGTGGNLLNGEYVGTKWQVYSFSSNKITKDYYDYIETDPYVVEIKTRDGISYESRILVSQGGEWVNGKYVGGKYGYLKETGDVKIPLKYDDAKPFASIKTVSVYIHGYGGTGVVWRTFVKSNGKWGMINGAGQVLIPIKYDELSPVIVGQNQVRQRVAVKLNGKWGFIRGNGLDAIPCIYEEVTDFRENPSELYLNFAGFKKDGKWGIINEDGKEVIFPRYDEVLDFFGDLLVVKKDEKYGFLNIKGEEIITPSIDNACYLSDKLVLIKKDGKWGVIKEDGKDVVSPKYDEIGEVVKLSKKNKEARYMVRVAVKINNKWGFLNEKGEEIIPIKYDIVREFKDLSMKNSKDLTVKSVCISSVKLNDKWGFIDENGQEIIPPKYNDVGDFKSVLEIKKFNFQYLVRAVVKNDKNKWGIIDLDGKEIVASKYDEIGNFYVIKYYENFFPNMKENSASVVTAKLGEKYGILDLITGNEITPFKYDYINGFKGVISSVKIDGKLKFINTDGKEIENPIKCDENWKFVTYVEEY